MICLSVREDVGTRQYIVAVTYSLNINDVFCGVFWCFFFLKIHFIDLFIEWIHWIPVCVLLVRSSKNTAYSLTMGFYSKCYLFMTCNVYLFILVWDNCEDTSWNINETIHCISQSRSFCSSIYDNKTEFYMLWIVAWTSSHNV